MHLRTAVQGERCSAELHSFRDSDRVTYAQTSCILQVLAKLWKVDLDHVSKLILLLGDAGIVRHATLESGAMWCVPTRTSAAALRHVFREDSAIMHAAVLAVYEDQPSFSSWERVKDDGFIVLQLMRHLAVTCRLDDIRCAPPLPTHSLRELLQPTATHVAVHLCSAPATAALMCRAQVALPYRHVQ